MSKVPKQRKLTVVAAALAALCLITMTVAAKYITSSGVLSGVFTPSPYGHPTVVENVITDPSDGFKYKTGVAVQTDDTAYAVYVRLALVISWKDDNGDVYGEQPFQDTDYTLERRSLARLYRRGRRSDAQADQSGTGRVYAAR